MADDIDIEEHDVLESLLRRQTPAVVKQEPLDEEYEVSRYEPDSEYYQSEWSWEASIDPSQIKTETPDNTDVDTDAPFGKIILGTKPTDSTEDIEPTDTRDEEVEKETETEVEYNYNMSLVLEDWGPILKASNCYCTECEILFATVNALDAHKMAAHSFLIAMDKEASPERNKAVKSTTKIDDFGNTCQICKFTFKGGERLGRNNLLRHYRNVHQIDPMRIKSENELKNWKICNHCNIYFPSDTALVKHLYELLPLNDKGKDEKSSPVKTQSAVKPDSKITPKVARPEKKIVKSEPVSSQIDTTPVPKPVVVKAVKQTPKQANSLILGSKINGVTVDNKNDEHNNLMVRKCEVCGIEYSRKYYIIHMRKFHPEVLIMKMNRLKKLHPINVSSNVRYKCSVCHMLFDGPSWARRHRAEKHPEMKGRKMFLKIVKTSKIQKGKVKPKILNLKKHMHSEEKELVVSRSTLFKCNRCSVHFLTCYGACAHSRVCETSSNLRDWSCPQCQRVFKNVDKVAHEFQHQHGSAKFKVYVVYLEMVVRILCECPCCYVCFEEYKFWRHVKFGCEKDTESFFCKECRLPIDSSSKSSHESKHNQGDFTKEDFIKVDFVSSGKQIKVKVEPQEVDLPVPSLKRKLTSPGIDKRKKRDEKMLFYCPFCKNHLASRIKQHTSGKCKTIKAGTKKISCRSCGIGFTPKSIVAHLALHKKYPNMTLSDLTFIRITDEKKIRPIPDYYPCKKCNVTFIAKWNRSRHDCGKVKTFNCQLCQKRIDKASFKNHMRFHSYTNTGKKVQKSLQNAKPTAQSETEVKSPTKQRKEPNSLTEGLPELLMKYKSLTTLWNILYVCETCDTFTDSYDKVVEHCQNHFISMESYGVVIMKCQICNMKFDRECYRRHLEIHGSTDISRKSFKILRYDHTKLFSTEWLHFIDLPEDQKTQLLSRSMYGVKSYVRLRLEQQGPPEYTLYRCKLCQKCINPDAIVHHMSLTNCLKANKITCPHCSVSFANRPALAQHLTLHESTHLEAESFRIVAFNDSMDAELNKKILAEYNSVERPAEEAPKAEFSVKYPNNVKLVKGSKFYMFYKCVDCQVCTLDAVSKDHVCPTSKKVCPKCDLTFSSNKFSEHIKLHDEISFSEKNVFTRTFYNQSTSNDDSSSKQALPIEKSEAKLYKCHCGLHFTSLKTIEKHYTNKNCSSVVREKCSHCYLLFDPNEIVNHLCKHHAQKQSQKFKIVIPNKKTLFKCRQCHVLFYNKKIGVAHSDICDGVSKGIKCDACGIAFDKLSIKTHTEEHKVSGKEKLDCYIIENIVSDPTVDNSVLYKCKKCDLHYTELTSIKSHVRVFNHQFGTAQKCNQCGLRFTVTILRRHIELHHNMLKIDRFRIKCYPFPVNSDEGRKSSSKASVNSLSTMDDSEVMKTDEIHKIYRCKKCKLHFTDIKTLVNHNEDRCSKELVDVCELCSYKFSAKNIKKHNKQHNGEEAINMDISEDYEKPEENVEDDENGVSLNIYKCVHCGFHFNLKKSCVRHLAVGCDKIKLSPVKCDICDAWFTKQSVARHRALHETYKLTKDGFNVIDISDVPNEAGNDDKNDSPSEEEEEKSRGDIVLYKCQKCSYHFNVKGSCESHRTIKGPPVMCDECGVAFTKHSIKRHKLMHERYKLKKRDFEIVEISNSFNECIARSIETNESVAASDLANEDASTSNLTNEDTAACNLTSGSVADSVDDDKNDTATEEELDDEVSNGGESVLYKCKNCGLHFNMKRSCLRHIQSGCKNAKGIVTCGECNLAFSTKSSLYHKVLHAQNKFKRDACVIIYVPNSEGVDDDSLGADENSQTTENGTVSSVDSNLTNQLSTKNTNALDGTIDANSTDPESSQDGVSEVKGKAKITVYKCADCNVYFMAQKTCHKHIVKHTPLDPKDFIECKLCGFQFIITALQTHIKKHHAEDFKLDDVLVQEYRPSVMKNNFPDMEVYCAIDREQSSLVTTSSDFNNGPVTVVTIASELDSEFGNSEVVSVDSSEITSNCNELR